MIETERLNLRTFTLEDKDFLYKLNNHKEVNKYRSSDTRSLDKCADDIKRWNEEFKMNTLNVYLIELKKTETPIGLIFLVRRNEESYIELGYRLLSDYWKKGYCKESAKALINKFFSESTETQIHAETHPDNINSIKFLLNLRFKEMKHELENRGRLFLLDKKETIKN